MKLEHKIEIGDPVLLMGEVPGVVSGFFPIVTKPAHADVCPMCQCPSLSLFAAGWPCIDIKGDEGTHIDPRRFEWSDADGLWQIGPPIKKS